MRWLFGPTNYILLQCPPSPAEPPELCTVELTNSPGKMFTHVLSISHFWFISSGFNPEWNENFQFDVYVPELAKVRFLVEDHDAASNNEFVGQYTLPFNSLQMGKLTIVSLSSVPDWNWIFFFHCMEVESQCTIQKCYRENLPSSLVCSLLTASLYQAYPATVDKIGKHYFLSGSLMTEALFSQCTNQKWKT